MSDRNSFSEENFEKIKKTKKTGLDKHAKNEDKKLKIALERKLKRKLKNIAKG